MDFHGFSFPLNTSNFFHSFLFSDNYNVLCNYILTDLPPQLSLLASFFSSAWPENPFHPRLDEVETKKEGWKNAEGSSVSLFFTYRWHKCWNHEQILHVRWRWYTCKSLRLLVSTPQHPEWPRSWSHRSRPWNGLPDHR